MSKPKYDWEAECAARVARMEREQEERAKRYLGELPPSESDVPETLIAWVLVGAMILVIAAVAALLGLAAVWLFRD